MSPKNIFISHVHEDDELVQNLKQLLTDNGYEIRDGSIDSSKPNDATDPSYIKSEILAPRIRWASTIIVLVSSKTHVSEYVNWEIEYAQSQEKRIVGLWAQGAKGSDLPESLLKYRDAMVGWQAERVMDAITGKIDTSFAPDGSEMSELNIDHHNC